MAGCTKQFDFVFDGGLLSHTRASLINEVIKQLLYERNQIPLQFDILKRLMMDNDAKHFQVFNCNPPIGQNHGVSKAKKVITGLDQIFENILKAFESCPEIQQAMILLGSTPVTPRESYIIKLPHICPEADNIALQSSKEALCRHLVSAQILSSDKKLGPTNIYFGLCAPRSASLSGFVPKITFKLPTMGYSLILNMICRQPSFSSQDLTMDDAEVEISGIEPLEFSSFAEVTLPVMAGYVKSPSPKKVSKLSSSSNVFTVVPVRKESDSKLSDEVKNEGEVNIDHPYAPVMRSTPKFGYTNLIPCDPLCTWFQCVTVLKGYQI